MEKTIIYGGAFDPPHLAHELIVRHIAREECPDRLLIVPSGPRTDKSYKVAAEHRTRIVQIFAEDLADIGAELFDGFMTGEISDGTTLGVDRFFTESLGMPPIQVFGTDVIPNMCKWDPTGRVERIVPKIFVSRPDSGIPDLAGLDNYHIVTPDFPEDMRALSSTTIRGNIKRRVFRWLDPKIAGYIQDNNLYL